MSLTIRFSSRALNGLMNSFSKLAADGTLVISCKLNRCEIDSAQKKKRNATQTRSHNATATVAVCRTSITLLTPLLNSNAMSNHLRLSNGGHGVMVDVITGSELSMSVYTCGAGTERE